MLITNNEGYYKKAKLLRSHGMTSLSYERSKGHSTTYDVVELGYNYRMDDIRASIGIVQLNKLQADLEKRILIRKQYVDMLSEIDGIIVPFAKNTEFVSNYIMPIVLKDSNYKKRDKFRNYLHKNGVQTSVHYPAVHKFSIYKKFSKNLPYINSDKVKIAILGDSQLKIQKNSFVSVQDCIKKIGLKNNSIIISIGYSRTPAHQHLKVLNSLIKIKEKLQRNITILIPFTYGPKDELYKKSIVAKLEELGLFYKIFENFMSEEEVVCLRRVTDIFIQVQTIDAFSASNLEHMYENGILITGNWLPYQKYDEVGFYYHKVETIKDIENILPKIVDNLKSEKLKTKNNPQKVWELKSWEKCIQPWLKIYNELLEQ